MAPTLLASIRTLKPFINHPPQHWKTIKPLGGLEGNRQHRLDELRIGLNPSPHSCLERKRTARLQTTLHRHEPKLAREFVRVIRLQTQTLALSQQKKPMRSYLCEGRHRSNTIEQKRDQVIARRSHAGVLMIDDAQMILLIKDQVECMKVAMTKYTRTAR